MEEEPSTDKKDGEDGSDDESGSGDDESSSSSSSGSDSDDFLGYRSPIVCIMGHVDTGKTKLLDKIRNTNVQEGEAGGITQQIGATFFPDIALEEQTNKVNPNFELELPGLLIIDTPGHESFNNLRKRGSSLCDFAILVIDIMHGLEPQTVESLDMLRKRKCPFIIAMNKIDVCYSWKSEHYTCIKDALGRQEDSVRQEFKSRFDNVMLQLNQKGLNCALYWENTDIRSTVSIVPTSALTGEGVPDLLYCLLNLSQQLMATSLEVTSDLSCSVIEVKNIEGHGTTIDVVLINGVLHEGDQIVIAGMGGPIVTTIRALLTPAPMKEMRVKGEYVHHAKIDVSMGVKISAPGLEEAVAGCELKVVGPDDDLDDLKEEVQDSFDSILDSFQKETAGVYVKTSTLGSLEALLSFLSESKIPVFDVGIGEVSKKDVKKTTIMKEKGHPEFAVILAFDIKVSAEATLQATHDGVQIFTADIIYHLFDRFTTYMKQVQDAKKVETRAEAVFPVALEIQKQYIIRQKDPIILGVKVVGGQLRVGTPICLPEKDFLEIGRVGSIERDHKDVKSARRGDNVCVKIEQSTAQNHIAYGRHFDHTNKLYSKISRNSIDTLKEHFKDEMKKEDWELIIGMKTLFKIG
jgi:translation initiation factor aIF-2/yIF-2